MCIKQTYCGGFGGAGHKTAAQMPGLQPGGRLLGGQQLSGVHPGGFGGAGHETAAQMPGPQPGGRLLGGQQLLVSHPGGTKHVTAAQVDPGQPGGRFPGGQQFSGVHPGGGVGGAQSTLLQKSLYTTQQHLSITQFQSLICNIIL